MASSEMSPPPRPNEESAARPPLVEIPLTAAEIDNLYTAILTAFPRDAEAQQLLRRIDYPPERIPTFTGRHREAWTEVFFAFEQGVIDAPYVRVLAEGLRVYGRNRVLLELAEQYRVLAGDGRQRAPAVTPIASPPPAQPNAPAQPGAAQPATSSPATAPTCHVIVSALSEDERQRTASELRHVRLEPQTVWSTSTAISFEVNSDDESFVRRRLDQIPNLSWTVVGPGQPDYLFRNLRVEGPDRRQFQITDAPAQETFRDIAEEVILNHYPQGDANAELPTLIEHVQDGQRHSVNPDTTLHNAGVRDGDQLRVGYQTNAGSVHPDRHEAALVRARNQIQDYANSPAAREIGFEVRANAPLTLLPTAYELEFTRRSFGFPIGAEEGAEVIEIHRHVVSLQLGPEFPQTPPQLWWMTPILHPNIYPNYPSPEARAKPKVRGLVCLGIIGDSWQDSMDFGDLCRMLVEMAGFRNYSPFEIIDTPSGPKIKGNSYDIRAADWVMTNQDRIKAIGGEFLFPHRQDVRTYRNVIEEIPR